MSHGQIACAGCHCWLVRLVQQCSAKSCTRAGIPLAGTPAYQIRISATSRAGAVPSQTRKAISDAVNRCLGRMSPGATPLGVLAEFLVELKDAGWHKKDRLAVDSAARHMLAGIVDTTVDPTSAD